MGMEPGGFNKVNDMREQCFRENGRLFDKYGHESIVFFLGMDVFLQNMCMGALIFS